MLCFVISCRGFLLLSRALELFMFLSQFLHQESNDEALHFDAHVLDVQRKQHDIRGCRCLFHVEYDHDQSQEMVNLKRISRRPRYL
ncbi:unnamed protein product [Triticum turgidum subsp. durum]|uniref:SAWADEE domain-containing protein n=1 Tax=Triticum turgidum subsp. durum TaxID=4567 RepID=A0A9R0X7Y0_TRITD|nr:unnamed protein product [Triticum turgidum subsp. durum]